MFALKFGRVDHDRIIGERYKQNGELSSNWGGVNKAKIKILNYWQNRGKRMDCYDSGRHKYQRDNSSLKVEAEI